MRPPEKSGDDYCSSSQEHTAYGSRQHGLQRQQASQGKATIAQRKRIISLETPAPSRLFCLNPMPIQTQICNFVHSVLNMSFAAGADQAVHPRTSRKVEVQNSPPRLSKKHVRAVLCLKSTVRSIDGITPNVGCCTPSVRRYVRERAPVRNERRSELVREEPGAAACRHGRRDRCYGPKRQPILQGREV